MNVKEHSLPKYKERFKLIISISKFKLNTSYFNSNTKGNKFFQVLKLT